MSGGISARVSNLKFMQRSIKKNELEEKVDNKLPEAHNEEHWIAPRKDGEKGCVVLLEGDPPATSGRMSFQGFSTDATTAKVIGKDGSAEVPLEGVSVGDEAMAEKLGNKTKKKKHSKKKAEPEQFHRGVKKFKSKK